jgi:zinc protease
MIFRQAAVVLLFFCLLLTNLVPAVSAQQAEKLPDGVTKVVSVEGVTEYRLANGLQILLYPDKSKQNVMVNITYHVGSRHEGYGETGMAHLLEHLVFKGTPKYGNIPAEMTKRGMAPNGTTSFDRTNYFAFFPPTGDNLEFYLDMEADRMVNSFIAKKDLDSEFSVVRNEMESGENNPTRILLERVRATAYQWHNYGKSTIGARSDVENVKIENLQAFYRKYYQPDNATLIVGGNFDVAKTLELINQKFGPIPKPSRTLEPTWTTDPPQDGERQVIVRRVGDTQLVAVGYHMPPVSSPDFAPTSILASVLGASPSGPLYKGLVESKKATSVSGSAGQSKEQGYMLFFANLNKDQSAETVRDTMIEILENYAANLPSKEEVDRQKVNWARLYERIGNDLNLMVSQLSEWSARGDWRLAYLTRDRLQAVTPEDVQRMAKTYLLQSNRTVGMFVPTEKPVRAPVQRITNEQIAAMVKDVKGGETVAEGEVFETTPANIEARTKRSAIGGIKTAFLTKKSRANQVNLRLTFRWGDEKSLLNLKHIGVMTGRMLGRATMKRTRQQIRDEINRLKAVVEIDGVETGAVALVTTNRENLPAVMRLVAEILKEPNFQQSDLDELKSNAINALEASRSDPGGIVNREMRIAFNKYPKGDIRYAGTLDEEIAENKAVTLDAVKKFYKDFYGASHGELAVVGDFDENEVNKLVTELFGNWKSPKPYKRVESPYFEVKPFQKAIETPDKANAVFQARLPLKMRDDHPDYPALVMGNFILGGGFLNSRLATRIRQKEGISYSIGSVFSAGSQDDAALFFVQAIYAPENVQRLENAVREEITKAVTEGFTAKEVEEAKQGWLLGRQRSRADDGAIRTILSSYLNINRTFAWDAEMEKKVASLTVEQVNAAMRKYINLDRMSIVKAGDFAKAKNAGTK